MTPSVLLAYAFNATLGLTCAYAIWRGGRPERFGAAINIVASGVTTILRLMSPRYFAPADPVVLAIDSSVGFGFFWLAVTTNRFWPIWALGFAVADIVISVAGGLLSMAPLFAYHTGLGAYAYLALASLVIGTFRLPRNASEYERAGHRRSLPVPPAGGSRPARGPQIAPDPTRGADS